jgi:hypothetical protein
MAYFDWDIGPKRRRWEAETHGGAMASKEDTTYWLTHFEDLCTRRGLMEEERHMIWEAMAHICYQQIQEKRGAFYDALYPLLEGQGEATQTDLSLSG